MSKIYNDWTHRDATKLLEEEFACGHVAPFYQIDSIHALNALVGYCKYQYRTDGNIYFRGQTDLYDSMKPSLFRSSKKLKVHNVKTRKEKLNIVVNSNFKKISLLHRNMDEKVAAPLFQHYGIKTDWIDLVDNLWIALWFAVHRYIGLNSNIKYEHVQKIEKEKKFVYLYLMLSDANRTDTGIPGYYDGEESELVDLRIAAPSMFLRPHNQHAILLKKKRVSTSESAEMATMVKLVIKLDADLVMEWLGKGRLLTVENIYPPPIYDQGYSVLLNDCIVDPANEIGCIKLISHEAFI